MLDNFYVPIRGRKQATFNTHRSVLPLLKVVNVFCVDHGKMIQESWKIMEKSWNLIPEKRWEPCLIHVYFYLPHPAACLSVNLRSAYEKRSWCELILGCVHFLIEPTCAYARWALMHCFLYVCLSVVTWPKFRLDQKSVAKNLYLLYGLQVIP